MKHKTQIIALLLALALALSCLSGCTASANRPDATTQPPAGTTQPEQMPPATQEPSVPANTQPPVSLPVISPIYPTVETKISGVTAKSAFAYSYDLDAYTYIKGDLEADLYPASVTKLFTAYVVTQHLDPDATVTAGNIITTVPSDASIAGLYVGDRCTVRQLLHGLLLCSGADAALVLAVEAGRVITGDSALSETAAVAQFVDEMNRQADAMGLVNSHFENVDGYHHADHHTCLADVVTISCLVLEHPVLKDIVSASRYSTTVSGRSLDWYNTNYLVNTRSGYYIPTAIGLKTGNTSAAGRCLVAAFLHEGELTVIGVFGCLEREDHFKNIRTIYDHFFS